MTEARISVWMTPRAREDKVVGWQDGSLRVRVAAPPVDGKANDALLRLLARELGITPNSVRLVSGHTSRRKVVAVAGMSIDDVGRRLALA
jgi:uncharacterized protein (TIGR00251 family)